MLIPFPAQIRVSHSRDASAAGQGVIEVAVRGGDRRQMRIVTDLVVSHDTVTDTGLEERDRFLQWFHELLVREYPARRYGWKITPTIVLTETGGTIPTHRCA